MDILTSIILFCVGGFAAMLLDVMWWNIDYKKAEKILDTLKFKNLLILKKETFLFIIYEI